MSANSSPQTKKNDEYLVYSEKNSIFATDYENTIKGITTTIWYGPYHWLVRHVPNCRPDFGINFSIYQELHLFLEKLEPERLRHLFFDPLLSFLYHDAAVSGCGRMSVEGVEAGRGGGRERV